MMMSSNFALLFLAACSGGDGTANTAIANEAAAIEPVGPATPAPGATPAAPALAPAAAESLEAFWTRFRRAALANDAAAIGALSAPIVAQHGELDDSPVEKLTSAQVPAVLAKILARPDGVDDAGRTQRALLEAAASPPADPDRTADNYRFGDMEFELGADGWKLVRVYDEAE